jgi:hypothetical protein
MNSQPLSEWKPGIITRIKLPPYPVLLREEQHQSDTFSSFASACLAVSLSITERRKQNLPCYLEGSA